jgi:hypothetical protein
MIKPNRFMNINVTSGIKIYAVYVGADKSLALPISYFPICSTTKRLLHVFISINVFGTTKESIMMNLNK